MGCVATVRGAMKKAPGVYGVDVQANVRDITVHYRPAETDVDQILVALEAAGEPAKKK